MARPSRKYAIGATGTVAIGTVHATDTTATTARAFTSTSGRGATIIGTIDIIGITGVIAATSA